MSGSIIKVTFINGEQKECKISAGPAIVGWLAKTMSETGFLSMWYEGKANCVPTIQIREFSIEAMEQGDETNDKRSKRSKTNSRDE